MGHGAGGNLVAAEPSSIEASLEHGWVTAALWRQSHASFRSSSFPSFLLGHIERRLFTAIGTIRSDANSRVLYLSALRSVE